MSLFDTLRIAASGLTAQRLRMDVAASNVANADSTVGANGAYRPQAVVFTPFQVGGDRSAEGVAAVAVVAPGPGTRQVYDPRNASANADGYVTYPDVDVAAQMADLMGAARSYQLNATVVQGIKQSTLDALDIGR